MRKIVNEKGRQREVRICKNFQVFRTFSHFDMKNWDIMQTFSSPRQRVKNYQEFWKILEAERLFE